MTQSKNEAGRGEGRHLFMKAIDRAGPVLVSAALVVPLTGCSVGWLSWKNAEPAKELAQAQRPQVSMAAGWRVFQDKCASCHGTDATGLPGGGPNLLIRLRGMGHRRFAGLVLQRYDWGLPPEQARKGSAAQEALVNDIVAEQQGVVTMPAWSGEPVVVAHINDVYAYLAARSEGTLGPGRPTP
jgi:mono/diheme cytochrome c family protein